MCGIVGYTGSKKPRDVLVEGLKRLEYRGYDSAGVAIFDNGGIRVCRCEGKIAELEQALSGLTFNGRTGIGHTRWATHGRPSETNAHPHLYQGIAVVHNGIIENYVALKKMLKKEGSVFGSETDSEVLAHLFVHFLKKGHSFEAAVREGLSQVRGSYAVAAVLETEPSRIIVARKESPLILGLGKGENFIASDIPAILSHTRDMVFLNDGEIAVVDAETVEIKTLAGDPVEKKSVHIAWDPLMAEKDGYRHFMLKEIFEQPRAIIDTLRGRILEDAADVFLDGVTLEPAEIDGINKICFIACGTSYYAGLVGKFMVEDMARLPAEVDLASEFRYRDPIVDAHTLIVLISQSG